MASIIEDLFGQMKQHNQTIKIYQAFTPFDPDQTGMVSIAEFKDTIGKVLKIKAKAIDLEFLASKYIQGNATAVAETLRVVQYQVFVKDFEEMERKGLRSHMASDPLLHATSVDEK